MNHQLMAGQRLIFGFDGIVLNDDLKHIIKDLKACGLILFKRNIQSPEQVKELCNSCQAFAKENKIPPLIICADQEGGVVARFRKPFTEFEGNPHIKTIQEAENFAKITSKELGQVGINMNLAPVLDFSPVALDSIMKERVFPGSPQDVSNLGMAVINTLQKNGMMAVAKHFPGIGRTVKDSHFHLPVLDINLETLEQSDMIPFADAIKHDVSGIMLSHISYPRLDDTWQASLSPTIANDLLRKKMGYDGLVFTDDLDMKAIKHDIGTCIRQILLAGIDISLICHKGPNIDLSWEKIIEFQQGDEFLKISGQQAVDRIWRFKKRYLLDFVS